MESPTGAAHSPRWGRITTVALVLASLLSSVWMFNGDSRGRGSIASAAQEADAKAEGASNADGKVGENPFPGRAPAPSLEGGVEWLNTSGEISLKDLRGKVVLLDFWTYCCINCIHILPDLKMLEKKYENQLVVIGVHHPKFENEHDSENIREAILRYEIEHPVVNDANSVIAQKYGFSSWPTLMLVDPEGNFVGQQPGEGTGELFDNVIGRMIAYHRAKGTLDETPLKFNLERANAEKTPLRFPGKILADVESDRLFISDSNHNRIVVSSLSGELKDVIGTGAIGRKDGTYAEATFDHPQGMALVGKTLYVADTENHSIRAIDLEAKQVTTLTGTGKQSRSRASSGKLRSMALNSPWALTHLKGKLYIAMAGPHQLWVHTLGSDQIKVFAGSGREDILDGDLLDAALAQPSGITHDGEWIYHVDSEGSAIRKVGKGKVETIVGPRDFPRGRSLFEFGDIDGKDEKARLQHPLEVLFHEGQLFVADTYNHKIKVVDLKTRSCTTWLGTGKRGTELDPVQLAEPAGLTIANGLLYVADTNNHRLLTVDLKTKATKEFVVQGLTPPAPVEVESQDSLEAIPLPAITAKVGTPLRIQLNFELPPLHKLNPIGKVGYKLTPMGESNAVAPDAVKVLREAEGQGTVATLELPITAAPGQGTYGLLVNFTYCSDEKGAVCRFGRQKWKLSITTQDDGSTELVQIPVSVKEG